LHGELRQVIQLSSDHPAWLGNTAPNASEDLTVSGSEVRIENGPTLVLLRNGFLSWNQTEAGRFSAAVVMIASPWFHQTFSQLRGATHWEADHLTIAGLTLTHGSTCSPLRPICRAWETNAWDCSSTPTRSAEKSAETFRTNGALNIPTGELPVGLPIFLLSKLRKHSDSSIALAVCSTLVIHFFAKLAEPDLVTASFGAS